jgi:hypothetical protein
MKVSLVSKLPPISKIYATIVSGLVLVLIFINIIVSAQVAYWGYETSQLQTEAAYLSDGNRLLQEDIARQTSLTKMLTDAQALGYTATVAYTRLAPVNPIAMSPNYQP